jgi:hypothetical protein
MGFFLIASSLWILEKYVILGMLIYSRATLDAVGSFLLRETVVGMLYIMFGHQPTDCPVFCEVMTSCFGRIRNLTPSQTDVRSLDSSLS